MMLIQVVNLTMNLTVLGKGVNQKTGCLNIKKSRQPKVVGVELRAGGDVNRSEKPGWSAGDMDKLPRKLLRHPVSPKGILLRLKVKSRHPRSSHLRSSHPRSSHPKSSYPRSSYPRRKHFFVMYYKG